MSVKIFHTADLHIGMKFNNYPEPVKGFLQQARVEVLEKMVAMANEENCSLFVVSGDLFHNIKGIDKKTVSRVASVLGAFQGECVLVLPGNHDYDNNMIDLWTSFNKLAGKKILFLNQERPYSLEEYGLDAVVYPAPCHSKHSDINNLGWLKEQPIEEMLHQDKLHIGIAHGSLEGISPDLEINYFPMSLAELDDIPANVWLLGHTHISYPDKDSVAEWKVFFPGTPEPDGLDCRHSGNAWIINIDEGKAVRAERVTVGIYRFFDEIYPISDKEDLEAIIVELTNDVPETTVARIHLKGRVDEEVFDYRYEVYRAIEDAIAYLIVDDSDLGIRITKEKIFKEFSQGSFPQQFLAALAEEEDEDALQIGYELVMEVRK